MTELTKKSVHELRQMAQAYGVTDIFEKSSARLIQEIELKAGRIAIPVELPPRPVYDVRHMTSQPSAEASRDEIIDMLESHIKLGLRLSFDDDCWTMSYGKREDTGTIRQPLRNILMCAERVLR